MTAVSTPSGKATSRSRRLLRVTPASRSQPRGVRGARAAAALAGEQVAARLRRGDRAQPVGRAAVEDARRRARPAPGPTSTIQSAWRITSSSCSTTNSELPAAFSRSSARSSASVSAGCKPGGRLVEHVDDAEQVRAHLRRQPQPLQLARRERRRAALERQVAEARGRAARRAVPPRSSAMRWATTAFSGWSTASCAQRGSVAARVRDAGSSESADSGRREMSGDVEPGERDRQRLGPQPLAAAQAGQSALDQVPRDARLHRGALGLRERLQHVAPGARERAHGSCGSSLRFSARRVSAGVKPA